MNLLKLIAIPLLASILWASFSCGVDSNKHQIDDSYQTKKPNILLIISDDQSYTDYSFMNHPSIETPRLDQFVRESLCYSRGYVTAPLCSPSLASIITGLYAHQHNVTGNDPLFDFDGDRYSEPWQLERKEYFDTIQRNYYENTLVTEYLHQAGYRSLQTGKWWLGSWKDAHFDEGMTHGDPKNGGRHGDEGLEIGRDGLDVIFDFMQRSDIDNEPFFVWYAPFLPHAPHNPPEDLLDKYLEKTPLKPLAQYWAMCEWFDSTCGQLFDFLDEQASDRETLIIYTSDNGWMQDSTKANRYTERSKRSPYEGGIRTPIILNWKGVISPKFDSVNLVSNIDLVPTILAAIGSESNPLLPGIDLLSSVVQNREIIFAEDYAHDILDVAHPTRSLQNRIAIEFPFKLISPNTTVYPKLETELYNLSEDPEEKVNIATKLPNKVSHLTEKLNNWWTPTGGI